MTSKTTLARAAFCCEAFACLGQSVFDGGANALDERVAGLVGDGAFVRGNGRLHRDMHAGVGLGRDAVGRENVA